MTLHLLRGFVEWTDRDTNGRRVELKTVDQAEEYVKRIAGHGFESFYTWTTRRVTRAAELEGGSVYFVRSGHTLFRMPFVSLDNDGDGFAICMRPELIRVEHKRVGMVRGWRYLTAANAPPDLPERGGELPPDLPPDLR